MTKSFTLEQVDNRCLVSGVIDFTTAREVLERVGAMVRSADQLQVSFAQVTSCNSAALALMVELKAVAFRSGHQVTFSDVPDGIGQLAKVCQVDGMIV